MLDELTEDGENTSIDRRRMLEALGAGGTVAVAGCLGSGGGGGGGGSKSIQFLTMGVGNNIDDFFQSNNAAFEKKHGVDLEFTSVAWDSAKTTVTRRVSGGKPPDVSRWPARWIPILVSKKAIKPLDDLMQGEFLKKFPQKIAEGTRYQDHYYGVPWVASNKCMFYNKDIFKKAGLDPENPQLSSWKDMLAAAKQIKDSNNVSKPALGLAGADAISTGAQYYHYHWSHGADLVNDNGKPVVNSPKAVDALSFYTDLSNKYGVTQRSPLSSDRHEIRNLFESGGLGMVIGHVYTGLNTKEAKKKGKVDFDFGIVQVPKGPGGRYSLFTIDTMAVYAKTEVKDLAYDLIKYYLKNDRYFEYCKKKGFLPVTKEVQQRDYFTESKVWSPFVKASKYARTRPKTNNNSKFNSRMVQAIQQALAEKKTPKEALNAAQNDLESWMS